MPRRRSPARLLLDKARRQWLIKDGDTRIRTGCAESERVQAEKRLAEYVGEKHKPSFGPDPLIADILLVYWREHLEHKPSAYNYRYNIGKLGDWWGEKRLSDITPANCRAFGKDRTEAAARHDLDVMRAAIKYWHRHHGPLPAIPHIVTPSEAGAALPLDDASGSGGDYCGRQGAPARAASPALPGSYCSGSTPVAGAA
jgi:hypothetical protein